MGVPAQGHDALAQRGEPALEALVSGSLQVQHVLALAHAPGQVRVLLSESPGADISGRDAHQSASGVDPTGDLVTLVSGSATTNSLRGRGWIRAPQRVHSSR